MFSCKSFVILLMFLAVSFGQSHNLIQCQSQPGDTLLQRESSARSFKFLQHASATVHINVGNNIINCIYALDQRGDGNGGYVETVKGGIGCNHVDVKITSNFNRDFSFQIEIYGQPRTCKYLRKCCVNLRTCPLPPTHTS